MTHYEATLQIYKQQRCNNTRIDNYITVCEVAAVANLYKQTEKHNLAYAFSSS